MDSQAHATDASPSPDAGVPKDVAPPVWVTSASGRFSSPRCFLSEWRRDALLIPRVAWRLFVRALIHQYRNSIFGVLLAFAPVVITILVIVFGRRAQFFSTETGGVDSAFFAAFGIMLAQAFAESLGSTQRLFTASGTLIRRQNLPVEAPILAGLFESIFRDLVHFIVVVVLMLWFKVAPTPWLLLVPWVFLGVSLAGGAIGLMTAPFAGLTAELQVFSRGVMLVVITVTPVFGIPAPDSALGIVQAANPLTPLFDGARAAAYGGSGSIVAAACLPLVAAVLYLVGCLVCRIACPHVIERAPGGGG